ncbi:MAG TPA: DUF2950 domain-containing protein [Verrucomicrobiae bacterium]|nr:DUF2950 domain-containing protein [Verrucomicrobiae bacterium]
MKTLRTSPTPRCSGRVRPDCCLGAAALFLFLWLTSSSGLDAAERTFPTPEEAVNALDLAVNTTNRAAFAVLFGPESERLANPDTVQGARELADFAAAFNATNRLVRDSDTRMILEVGYNGWPFPIPVVKVASGWQFDTAAGIDEIQNRRIGRNEIEVLRVMRAYVDAQREYASRDRDGDDVLEYAQKLSSSPGLTDGLFWPPDLNGELSPLGPLVASAQARGYFAQPTDPEAGPRPFHGYFFKILTRQGKHAPGGKYDYIINGNMIGGFGMVAWPAAYGDSGIMTFIVNQRGRVLQRDLGKNSAKIAEKMTAYDPDASWQVSPD